jgi:anti-sigma B factor antagonist
MKITPRRTTRVTILDCTGRLTVDEGVEPFRAAVDRLVAAGETRILLNLCHVVALDSSGLGEMVTAKTSAAARGASIKLLHLDSKVRRVIEMTQLLDVFEIFDNEHDAIASFDTPQSGSRDAG